MDAWRITWFTVALAALRNGADAAAGAGAGLAARAADNSAGRVLVETLVSLPLVMPPVATGLVLL